MADVKISELSYLPSGVTNIDAFEIPIDDGQNTYRLNVEDFNARGTTSASNYATAAAASAADALSYKNTAVSSAESAATAVTQATNAKTAAETAEANALAYKNAAESAKNDAVAAKNTINTAAASVETAVTTATNAATAAEADRVLAQTAASNAASSASSASAYCEDSEAWAKGTMNGSPLPSGTDFYHNNSKWYAEQASASATSAASDAETCATAAIKEPYIGSNGHWYVWSWDNNAYADTGVNATGATGNGVVSITKTSSSGKVDTYTILYTNGNSDTFTVTNGEDGQGSGDMLMTDYDHDQYVYNAGGIPAYVSAQISSYNTNTVSPALNNKMATDGNNAGKVRLSQGLRVGTIRTASDEQDVGQHSLTVGRSVLAAGKYSLAQGDYVIARGDKSHAEGYNDMTIKKHFTFMNDSYGEVMEQGQYVSHNFYGFTSADRVVFYVANNLVYDGLISDFGSVAKTASDTNYSVSLSSYKISEGIMMVQIEALQDILSADTKIAIKFEAYITTNAYGEGSHTEGDNCATGGKYAHAEGLRTEAGYDYQHVSGKYNANKATTLFEIGNGTADNARSNAFEVYADGTFSQNGTDKFKFAKSGGLDGFYDGSGNFHPFEPLYLEQIVTLSTLADTTVTFTNAAILTTSRIDAYTSDYTIVPTNVVAASGSCTVTFKKASTASTITVGIEVKN